ncbi:MAG: glycosyltransferase [Verrucomicrobiota bacterium]|nr:glycosyltransferase [Verrucomicrobiota bacterium]
MAGNGAATGARFRKVAIITRTKDRPLLLRRAMESVLQQTFSDWTHLIINDGGHPALCAMAAAEFRDRYAGRLVLINHARSAGMQSASNSAIRASASEYVVMHDDDDSWGPRFLNETVEFLESEEGVSYGGVITHTVQVNEIVTSDGPIETSRNDYNCDLQNISLFRMMGGNLFPPISFLYRRQVHESVGFFDQTRDVLGDWDFNVRLLQKFEIAVLPQKLAFYHWRPKTEAQAYANTVTAGLERHRATLSRIQNDALRAETVSGLGDGAATNISRSLTVLDERLSRLEAGLWHLNEKANRAPAPLPRRSLWDRVATTLRPAKFVLTRAAKLRDEVRPFNTASIAKRLRNYEAISFDIFDTAILRLTERPKDVFDDCQIMVRQWLGDADFPFADLRMQAERLARAEAERDSDLQDVNFDEIYACFARVTRLDPQTIARVKSLELATEERVCYPNPRVLDLYRKCHSLGRRTFFVSDTYLPLAYLQNLLASRGFTDPVIYASGECRKTKHIGSLFTHVVAASGVRRARLLHIGDNVHSDYYKAREKRIESVLLEDEAACRFATTRRDHAEGWARDSLFASVCIGLARKRTIELAPNENKTDQLWLSLGYEIAGPICCAYLSWLFGGAASRGIRQLYFLARDGHLLHDAFKLMKERWDLPFDATYTFASRRLFYLAAIRRIDEQTLAVLLTPNLSLTAEHFLTRIGLSLRQYQSKLRWVGLEPGERLTSAEGSFLSDDRRERLRRFFRMIGSNLLAQAEAERALLLEYLDQIHLFSHKPVALVDIGWAASVLRSLHEIAALEGRKLNAVGFFFATWATAQPVADRGYAMESYLVHLDKPARLRDVVMPAVAIIEAMFNAPHGSIVALQRGVGGEFFPSYGDAVPPYDLHAQTVIRRGALEFVDDFTRLSPTPAIDGAGEYLAALLRRAALHPTKFEAERIGRMAHRDGFGVGSPARPIARPPGRATRMLSKDSLVRRYRNSHWRAGFLQQLAPHERDIERMN